MQNNPFISSIQSVLGNIGQGINNVAHTVVHDIQQAPQAIQNYGQSVAQHISQQPVTNLPGFDFKVNQIPNFFQNPVKTIGNSFDNPTPPAKYLMNQVSNFSLGFTSPAGDTGNPRAEELSFNSDPAYSLGNFLGNDLVGAGALVRAAPEVGKLGFSALRGLGTAAVNTGTLLAANRFAGNKSTAGDYALPAGLSFILGSVGVNSNPEEIAKTVPRAMELFKSRLSESPIVGDINHQFTSAELDNYVSQLAGKTIHPAFDTATQDAIKLANYLDAARRGIISNEPPGIGLSVNDIRKNQQILEQQGLLDEKKPYYNMEGEPLPFDVNPPQTTKEAQGRLKSLLNYSDDLHRLGYTKAQIDKIGVDEGRYILSNELAPGEYYNKQTINQALTKQALLEDKENKFNSIFQPLKNQSNDIQDAFLEHDKATKVARVDANKIALEFKTNLDPELEYKLVKYSQKPTPEMAQELGLSKEDIQKGSEIIQKSREFNDQIYARAKESKIDLNYLQNHIYQAFKESPEQIDKVFQLKGLGSKPGFAQHRTIENFTKGEELGLTPRYTTFGQLNALAEEALQKAQANKALADKLKASGQLLPESHAPASWDTITARFFPRASVVVGRDTRIEQSYKAPPQLARFINNYFGGQQMGIGDRLLNIAARTSRVAQDIVLSGGIGSLNAFGIGQLIKEGTAGRFLTPLRAFFRSYSGTLSLNYERSNLQSIRELASEGFSVRGIADYKKLYKNIASNDSITEVIGKGWDKLMNENTFERFMPQLQIGFYNDTKNALLDSGLSEDQAIKIAAGATKKFYGISESLGRAQGVNDTLTAVFLAPKYREGMVNIFSYLAQSFKPGNWSNKEYSAIHRLAIGMALTYGMYNLVQISLTGKPMWNNPPGKEFELVIPDPNDKKHYYSIPWMPGFTAVPRRIAGAIGASIKGDIQEAVGQIGGLASIPLSKVFELIRNKDYFGNQLIDPNHQVRDLALYGVKSFLPGYGQAGVNYFAGKASLPMAITQALELPIKHGTFPNPYFTAKDAEYKKLSKIDQTIADALPKSDPNDPAAKQEKYTLLRGHPNVFNYLRNTALAASNGNPNNIDPLYAYSYDQAKPYLTYEAQNPGSADAKALYSAYPIIGQIGQQRQTYFQSNPIPNEKQSSRPIATDYVQKQLNAKNYNDPAVSAYLTANLAYNNAQRAKLGLTAIPAYQKKVPFRRLSRVKAKKVKLSFGKKIKLPKISLGKHKRAKLAIFA